MMLTHGRIAAVAVVVAACTVGCAGLAAPAPTPTPTLDIQSMVEAAIAQALAPTPTPTPDVQTMVEAAVNATLASAATQAPTRTPGSIYAPVPTYTPRPKPTSRPISMPTLMPTIPLAPTHRPTVIRFTVQPPRVTVVPATPTPESRRLQEVDCGPNCTSDYVPIWGRVDWISPPKISENGVIELVAVLDDGIDMGVLGTEHGAQFSVSDSDGNLYGTIVPPSISGQEWVPQPGLWIAERFDYVANTLRVRARMDPVAAIHPGLRLCLWSARAEGERSLLDCVPVEAALI